MVGRVSGNPTFFFLGLSLILYASDGTISALSISILIPLTINQRGLEEIFLPL